MKVYYSSTAYMHIDERWQKVITVLLSSCMVAAGLFFLMESILSIHIYLSRSILIGSFACLSFLAYVYFRVRRWWRNRSNTKTFSDLAKASAIPDLVGPESAKVSMDSFNRLQGWYTRQISELIVSHGVHCTAKITRGPFTLTYVLNLTRDMSRGLSALMSLKNPLIQAIRTNVRLTQSAQGVLLEIELPREAHLSPAAVKLASSGRWPHLPVGIDQFMRPLMVNPEEHGALYWIAPPRSGKTSSMRSTLAIAKQYRPDLRFIVCALPAKIKKDWGAFGVVDGCLGLVSDFREMEAALKWTVDQMNAGQEGPVFVVLDDLTNLTAQADIGTYIDNLALAGAGLGYHLLVGTHGAGSKATSGGSLAQFGMTCRLMFKAADNNSGARSAGRRNDETGLAQLSGYAGDAILDEHGRISRVATAMITDTEIQQLPASYDGQPRPWKRRAGVTNGVTSHGRSQASHAVVTPLVTPLTSGRGELSQVVTLSQSQTATPHAPTTFGPREGDDGVTVTTCDSVTIDTLPKISPERDATIEESLLILAVWETGLYSLSAISDHVYGQRNTRRNGRIKAAIALAEQSDGCIVDGGPMTKEMALAILASNNVDNPRRSEALVFLQKDVVIEGKRWDERGRPKTGQ